MTEEMSELDTDTEERKTEHGRKMAERAGLTLEEVEQGLPVWEVVRPAHRSTEVQEFCLFVNVTEWCMSRLLESTMNLIQFVANSGKKENQDALPRNVSTSVD